MKRRLVIGGGLALGIGLAVASHIEPASGRGQYEVWAIDQSDSPGRAYGGALYIWDGHELERRRGTGSHDAEHIDLGDDASTLCFSKTGASD